MRLLGRDRLRVLFGTDELIDAWVRSWVSELCTANWKSAEDVLRQFPRAREIEGDTFEFPISENRQCIHVLMTFTHGIALVIAIEDIS